MRAVHPRPVEDLQADNVKSGERFSSRPTLPHPRDFHAVGQGFLRGFEQGLIEGATDLAHVAGISDGHCQVVEVNLAQVANMVFHLLRAAVDDAGEVLLDLPLELARLVEKALGQNGKPYWVGGLGPSAGGAPLGNASGRAKESVGGTSFPAVRLLFNRSWCVAWVWSAGSGGRGVPIRFLREAIK